MNKNIKNFILAPCFCGRTVKLEGGSEDWRPTYNDPDSGGNPYVITCECGMTFSRGCCDSQEIVDLWNSKSPVTQPSWQVVVEGDINEDFRYYTFVGTEKDVKRMVKLLALKISKETAAVKVTFKDPEEHNILPVLLEYENFMKGVRINIYPANCEYIDLPNKNDSTIIFLDSISDTEIIEGDELRYKIRKMEEIYE